MNSNNNEMLDNKVKNLIKQYTKLNKYKLKNKTRKERRIIKSKKESIQLEILKIMERNFQDKWRKSLNKLLHDIEAIPQEQTITYKESNDTIMKYCLNKISNRKEI